MRKNAPRKWIHAILDLLPLLVIPIFAIYSQRHDIDTNVVQKEITKEVNFNQLLNPNPQNGFGIEVQFVNNEFFIANGTGQDNGPYLSAENISFDNSHKYYLSTNIDNSKAYLRFLFYEGGSYYDSLNLTTPTIYTSPTDLLFNPFLFVINDVVLNNFTFSFYITDLTQMFGSGNEPTIQQFNEWYPNSYYEYTIGRNEILYTGQYETLNETDIGSQFLYQMYNVTDKYFNFNRLFNMQGVYDWLQLNLFDGDAPLPLTIVWNIIVYEFFIDLIFLLYSVFMFFIDFATNMIDSFTGRCK